MVILLSLKGDMHAVKHGARLEFVVKYRNSASSIEISVFWDFSHILCQAMD